MPADRPRSARRGAPPRPSAALALALAVALASGQMPDRAAAQGVPFGGAGAEPGAPVEVTADALSIDRAAGTAVFEGGVVVGQGALRLSAERVEVEYTDDRRVARLTATGGVTLASGQDAAEAERAVYDVEAGEITLTGDVLLTQGEEQGGVALSADALSVDLASGQARLDGRVRTVLPARD